jgi:hypothetical protein
VSYPADQSRRAPGRRGFALFLAVVFLAVIGGAGGYLIGHKVRAERVASEQGSGSDGSGDGTGAEQSPSDGPSPTPVGTDAAPLAGTHCPSVSERDAHAQLIRVLYIDTAGSEVWICKDSTGGLWYQGHRKGGSIDSNDYGLLLPDVQTSGDAYVATHQTSEGTWKYLVSKKSLTIVEPGGTRAPEPALSAASG